VSTEPTIAVPVSVLRQIDKECRNGISPLVHWSLSRPEMDHAAMTKRGDALRNILDEVEALLPKNLP
jgi:hypothetical protein